MNYDLHYIKVYKEQSYKQIEVNIVKDLRENEKSHLNFYNVFAPLEV